MNAFDLSAPIQIPDSYMVSSPSLCEGRFPSMIKRQTLGDIAHLYCIRDCPHECIIYECCPKFVASGQDIVAIIWDSNSESSPRTKWRNSHQGYDQNNNIYCRLNRREQEILFRLGTGHCRLHHLYHKFGIGESDIVPLQHRAMTVNHVFKRCPYNLQP
jgi:hypothetical protein